MTKDNKLSKLEKIAKGVMLTSGAILIITWAAALYNLTKSVMELQKQDYNQKSVEDYDNNMIAATWIGCPAGITFLCSGAYFENKRNKQKRKILNYQI